MNRTHTIRPAVSGNIATGGSRGRARRATAALSAVERAALVAILALLVIGVWVTSARPTTQVHTQRVLTAPGDTLWTLASRYPVAGMTTQEEADLIGALNGIGGGASVPTQHAVVVPSTASEAAVALR